MYLKDHSRRIIVGGSHDLNILIIKKSVQCNKKLYHIFCCNMFVFACSIIAKRQCWLFAIRGNLPSYVRICSCVELPVSAQWSQILYTLLSKYKER